MAELAVPCALSAPSLPIPDLCQESLLLEAQVGTVEVGVDMG